VYGAYIISCVFPVVGPFSKPENPFSPPLLPPRYQKKPKDFSNRVKLTFSILILPQLDFF
jgi:hypothetical protein